MVETETGAVRETGAHLSRFRFRDLPQELREEIYMYMYFQQPPTASNDNRTDPVDDMVERRAALKHDPLAVDPNSYGQGWADVSILGFKISTSTSFQQVSKDVDLEVSRLIQTLHQMLASTIYLDRIDSPIPAFLDICSRIGFIIHQEPP
ncbi:hypothetical protein EJ07DRAFT_156228 [Lizonia empirigonia]|nr:hypothetical protein EJ07DRAFT_156228 [Lizonia empirigonia]